jgi:hypothetical protein
VRRARCLLVGGKSRLVYLAGSANAYSKVLPAPRAFARSDLHGPERLW